MRRLILLVLPIVTACAASPVRQAHESDMRCIHRLYDFPTRSSPFPTAANQCAGNRTVDLTGDPYFQVLASSFNVPFIDRNPKHDSTIVLTGSRVPQPTDQPPPPQVSLR